MYQRDYIMRLIATVGQLLRAMVHALSEKRPEDSLESAREAILALTDADPALLDAMTGDGLVTFLSVGGGVDTLRARLLAEVLLRRADAFEASGDPGSAAADRDRARALLDAAVPLAEGEDAEEVSRLIAEVRGSEFAGGEPGERD